MQHKQSSPWIVLLLIHAAFGIAMSDDDISSLPRVYRECVAPHLLVRQKVDGQRQSLAFLAQLRFHGGRVFNSFGDTKTGRCYRIVLLNSSGQEIHDIVSPTPAPAPDNEFLFMGMDRGLVGRCYWTDLDTGDTKNRLDDAASLPQLEAGHYRCIMLVTKRAFAPEGWSFYLKYPEYWNAPEMSQYVCASELVSLYLDKNGHWWADDVETPLPTFATLEAEPHKNDFHDLSLTAWLVNPESRDLVVPNYDLYLPLKDGTMRWSVARDDGFPLGRLRYSRGGSHRTHIFARHADIWEIPRNGIIGGSRSALGTFKEGGNYRVSVTIDESIFANTRFHNGKEMKPGPDGWKVVYRSPVVTVTVPEIPQPTEK